MMSINKEAQELLNHHCKLLESSGFSILHAYRNNIDCKIADEYYHDSEITLRVDSKNIIRDALIALYQKGSVFGQNKFRTSLNALLTEEVII